MSLTVVLLLISALIVIGLLKALWSKSGPTSWPLYSKKILTQPEQILYFRLVEALPNHLVFAQIQLSQFLGVKKGHNYQSWSNRINRMSADFVVCKKDSSVIAVIELDDSTHNQPKRRAADQKKDAAITAAGIPMIRWKVQEIPNNTEIKQTLQNFSHEKLEQPQS